MIFNLTIVFVMLFSQDIYAGGNIAKVQKSQPTNTAKPANTDSQDYKIGVFYFPGWKDNETGAPSALPWEKIKPYPDAEPLSGWYDEGSIAITEQQLAWMHQYGIDYVVYDWYWDGVKRAYLEHALASYLQSKNKKLVNFSVLWANHTSIPKKEAHFTSMVNYWIKNYFSRPEYQTIDGKPVVFVFSADRLENNAKKFGKTTGQLLGLANQIAIKNGFKGIYFVGGVGANDKVLLGKNPVTGYSAYSAYNYHTGRKYPDAAPFPYSHDYDELDGGYQYHWEWFAKNSNIPYIIPMTSGWNKRPWGGSGYFLHDNSISTPLTFKRHLINAKAMMDKYPDKSLKTGVICCWNEYGEGSYIEPTKKFGFDYLRVIREVFN